jgi:hypothetical protein
LARTVGVGLVTALIAGYALAALASAGFLPSSLFGPGVVIGSIASLVLLVLFFHPWLVLGVAVDIVLLWTILVLRWAPDFG